MRTSYFLQLLFCLLLTCSNLFGQELKQLHSAFDKFKQAIIISDCNSLIEISLFPIEGDCGLIRILDEKDDELFQKAEELKFLILKDNLLKDCSILDSIEIEVLKGYELGGINQGVEFEGCIYKGNVEFDKSYQSFRFSVGCNELINEPIGEYSIIFIFNWINDQYILQQIICAG